MKPNGKIARRIGVVGLVGVPAVFGTVVLTAAPASAKTTTLHLYDKNVASGAFAPAGQPLNPRAAPAVGDYVVETGTDYMGTHKNHSKKPVGASNLVCTITSSTAGFCDGVIAIGSSLLLVDHVPLNLTGSSPLTVSSGTGQFKGYHGVVTAATVANSNNNDFTVKLSK